MVLRTRAAGRTGIRVTVQPLDPSAGQFEDHLPELLDEVQVLVFEKLQLFTPERPAEQILMSTNSQLELRTNRKGATEVNAQILQCYPNSSVIEVSGRGLLKAGAVTGTAVLEVTSSEPFGVNQTVVTGVRVRGSVAGGGQGKPRAVDRSPCTPPNGTDGLCAAPGLRPGQELKEVPDAGLVNAAACSVEVGWPPCLTCVLSASPKLYTAGREPLRAFPLGISFTLRVHFHDSAGERFLAQSTRLSLVLNRDDLLLTRPTSRNYTYLAQAVNRGVTLVGVWDERHPGMADYLPVPVEHAIGPNLTEPLAVGDVVCFSCPLVSPEGEPGVWQVSPSDVLETDPLSGAAFAKNAGKLTVFYEIPGAVKTYREVVIAGSSTLNLHLGPQKYLTNSPDASEFRVYIATGSTATLQGPCSSGHLQALRDVLLPESHLLCHVEFSETVADLPATKIFHTQPAFYPDQGLYACRVSVKGQSPEDLLALSTAEGRSVTVAASFFSQRGGQGEASRVSVPFWPAFVLNQSEVVLSSRQLSGEIVALGSRRVMESIEARPSSPVIQLEPPRAVPDTPGLVLYPFRVVNLSSLHHMAAPVFINLSCPLTGQRAAVLVRALRERHALDQCGDISLARHLVGSYQVALFTVFALLASFSVLFLSKCLVPPRRRREGVRRGSRLDRSHPIPEPLHPDGLVFGKSPPENFCGPKAGK
ncbi:hypothetical protein JRQ81_009320 [Phrynocephalus forsythii]|uniref:Uncharacterized protein n=1 Tax=Phrynocephalus forsythii TaxID=171643 RepID=A0A9Q0X9L3_9SAUR|nr:hypothetical protein JRQ81_009320 [Phrynocephalus forsythii]